MIRSIKISLYKCYKELNVKEQLLVYAKSIVELDKVDQQLFLDAKLLLANNSFDLSEFYSAKKEYTEISEMDKNYFGAHAKYQLAKLSFIEDDFQSVESIVFEIAESYYDDFYIAKSFILLSDAYLEQENYFQAKATLQSIVDNYQKEDLKIIAKEKLNVLAQLEDSDSSPDLENETIIDLLIDFEEEEIYNDDEE